MLKRYDIDCIRKCGCKVEGVTKTEAGLSEPLPKLIERFRQGRPVDSLIQNIDMSVPFSVPFALDITDRYNFVNQFRDELAKMQLPPSEPPAT